MGRLRQAPTRKNIVYVTSLSSPATITIISYHNCMPFVPPLLSKLVPTHPFVYVSTEPTVGRRHFSVQLWNPNMTPIPFRRATMPRQPFWPARIFGRKNPALDGHKLGPKIWNVLHCDSVSSESKPACYSMFHNFSIFLMFCIFLVTSPGLIFTCTAALHCLHCWWPWFLLLLGVARLLQAGTGTKGKNHKHP